MSQSRDIINLQLFSSIINNNQDLFDSLITNDNIDFNYQYTNPKKISLIPEIQFRKYTFLILAVKLNRLQMVKKLLKQSPDKLDRNLFDINGNSAIIMSVLSGNSEHREGINYHILKLLLEDPFVNKGYIKESNKSDPMTCALWVEDMTIIEMLIDYNVPVYWDHLDKWRRDYYNKIIEPYYYNKIIERYIYPVVPEVNGYL